MSFHFSPSKVFNQLYFYVIISIIAGIVLGIFVPETAVKFKVLGDMFLKLVKMIIAPVIFCTVISGIAKHNNLKETGKTGLRSMVYFEVVSSLALLIGWGMVKIIQPGRGLNIDPSTLDTKNITSYLVAANQFDTGNFISNIIPSGFFSSFISGEILQVLFVSILFGISLSAMKEKSQPLLNAIDQLSAVFFGIVNIIMKAAPVGAFGAMAFTAGKFGFGTLYSLFHLLLGVYVTCLLFIVIVLGSILRLAGFNIFKLIHYIRDEIFLVLATSSSEAALPGVMKKMEELGCRKSIVGLVIPTGYSFNLDGTSIYLVMAAIFIAQATNTSLSLGQELVLIGVLIFTSKGAAAVTGGGFITLAATLSSLDTVPVAGISLLLGIDRFMSEARAITNLIGNGVATIVVSRLEKGIDENKAAHIK
jgi:aerobic C4-dicarboxylate transport protein